MEPSHAPRYELLDRIAVGGTAEVYRATAVAADGQRRKVVLKRLLPQLARDRRFHRLFVEEARLAATLSHPNIVSVLDHGDLDGVAYLALEPIDGLDLAQILALCEDLGERIPIALAATIVAEVASALAYAHGFVDAAGVPLRIVHRDVSPANILVSFQGDVKLTDFGIADIGDAPEASEGWRGKVDYLAPEDLQPTFPSDHRSDLFALGCVLFELCAGTPPFRGHDEAATLARLEAFDLRPPISSLALPAALEKLLDELLQQRPAARLDNAARLRERLQSWSSPQHHGEQGKEALGQWLRTLQGRAAGRASAPQGAVDDAVRALLGDPGGGMAPAPSSNIGEEDDDLLDEPRRRASTQQVPTKSPLPALIASAKEAEDAGLGAPRREGPSASSPFEGPTTGEVRRPTPTTIRPTRQRLPWLVAAGALVLGASALLWALLREPPEQASGPTALPTTRPTTRQGRAGATLRVESVPSGAAVAIDGRPRGRTPLTVTLPPKSVRLRLSKAGYRSRALTVDGAEERPTPLRLRLRRRPRKRKRGTLTLNSLPWSRVYLGGRYLGNTPLVRRSVPSGRHLLLLKDSRGKVRKRLRVTISAGRAHKLSFDLR